MHKRPIIAAGSALLALAFGAGIAHADPDPNDDPGEQRNWPCGYTFGPVNTHAQFGTIMAWRYARPCPPPPAPGE
ncbi:hypothetical protein SKC41_00690 [Mycobacterium sp. 050128]|uniref:hypothetical protein n=1 Tax=Mycobacterium sp. 050128 TaxID=3096112 RepID=UPI002EDAB42D